ncbi:MAG: tetratricopeptide repeat protein [Promethearchaeota archaeon]
MYKENNEFDNAINAFEKAVKIEPKNLEAWVNIGKIYNENNELDIKH